jgi:dolichol-phosphate mannosyltransferase
VAEKLISVVVPVFNERENVAALHERVSEVFESLPGYDLELIFTDNHSTDGTFDEIVRLASLDKRIRAYRFSRNFGFQRSILEGYRKARGDAAVQIDADLQDPPELIARFIELWEQGNAVVYGVRVKRPDPWHVNLARKAFYRFAALLSEDPLQIDAGDFRLVDRRVLDVLHQLDDAQPYLRGTIASMGFDQAGVEYERAARHSGSSKFSLSHMLALSLDGILNHSTIPLRVATYTGLAVSLVTAIGIVGYLVARFAYGREWPAGFATTTALLLLSISLNALFLGIIGEYLGRMYKQLKRGANTIIERSIEPAETPSDPAR